MRNLFLLRHAKSSWKDALLDDFERPLNKRGKRDAPQMAQRFSKRGYKIDLIILSKARRTTDTANIFINILDYKSKIDLNDQLYEASSPTLLRVINQMEDRYQNVLLVSHNPGLTNLANYLSNYFIDNIPTSGIVGLSTDLSWRNINEGGCTFLFFDFPKKCSPA